jgi:hypothetical protein
MLGKLVIEGQFIRHPQKDQGGAGDAQGETGYIQQTVYWIAPQAAENRKQVIFKHTQSAAKKMPVLLSFVYQ